MVIRRSLECTACGMNYRTRYRGRCPLCRTCQSARVQELHTASWIQLPEDVLESIARHLLRGMPYGPFEWAAPQHWIRPHFNGFLRTGRPSVLRGIDGHNEIVYVHGSKPPERMKPIVNIWMFACLPILRIKLVCKSLQRAVDAYLCSLLRPALACGQAAARIQRALAANFFPRVRNKRDDEYLDAMCWDLPEY